MIKSLIVLVFCFVSVRALSQEWIPIGETISHAKFFIRSTYVSKGKDILHQIKFIRIWIRTEYEQKEIKGQNYINPYSLNLYDVDRANQKLRMVSATVYDGEGKVLTSDDFGEFKFTNPIPDTMEETIVNKVCEMFGGKK
jgi:hypothetical protein